MSDRILPLCPRCYTPVPFREWDTHIRRCVRSQAPKGKGGESRGQGAHHPPKGRASPQRGSSSQSSVKSRSRAPDPNKTWAEVLAGSVHSQSGRSSGPEGEGHSQGRRSSRADPPRAEPRSRDRSPVADPPRRVVRVYDRGMERSPRAEPQSSVRPKTTSSESVVRPKVTGSVPGQAGPRVTASRGCPRSPVGIGRGKQILEMRAKGLLKSRQSEPAGASFGARDIRLKDPSFKHGGYRVGPEGATKIKTSDGSKDQGRMSRVDPPKSKPSTRSGNSAPSPGVVPLMDLVLPPPAPSVPSSTRPCPPPPPPPPQPPRTAGPSAAAGAPEGATASAEGRTSYSCPICQLPLLSMEDRRHHITIYHGPQPTPKVCVFCGKFFPSRTKYQQHKREVHCGEGSSGSQPSVPPNTSEGSIQTGPVVTTTSVVALLEDPRGHTGGDLQPAKDGGDHHSNPGREGHESPRFPSDGG